MKLFLAAQFLIFLIVKLTVDYIGLHYNGVDWSWSLAYGSLAVLPLILCRSWSLAICLLLAFGAWGYGRVIELSPNPHNIELIPYLYIMVAIACVLAERWLMALFAGLTALYAIRLTGVEISYWQQGLFNLLAAGLFLTYEKRKAAKVDAPEETENHPLEQKRAA